MPPKNRSAASSVLNYFAPQKGLFDSVEHFRTVYLAVTNALTKNPVHSADGSYLIKGMKVKFSKEVQEEEMVIDTPTSRIIFLAPILKGESKKEQLDRKMYYYGQLISYVNSMQVNGVTSIYAVMTPAAQKVLSKKTLNNVGKGRRPK